MRGDEPSLVAGAGAAAVEKSTGIHSSLENSFPSRAENRIHTFWVNNFPSIFKWILPPLFSGFYTIRPQG